MPMPHDKKRMATLIVNGMRDSVDRAPTNEYGDEVDNSIALESAAEDMIAAFENKDAGMLVQSLKAFFMMLEQEEDSMEV